MRDTFVLFIYLLVDSAGGRVSHTLTSARRRRRDVGRPGRALRTHARAIRLVRLVAVMALNRGALTPFCSLR